MILEMAISMADLSVMPIHFKPIKLAIRHHHAQMKAIGETRLFREAARNSRG